MLKFISIPANIVQVISMKVYICDKSCCPAVEVVGNEVLIGEDANTVRLKKNEWNKLVEKIQSGELHSI
jgi:hypothetical protein